MMPWLMPTMPYWSASASHRMRLEEGAALHCTGVLGDALRKGVMDAVLHQNAVGAHAGPAGVADLEAVAPPASAEASS
jgi:hypothetical protein